MIEYSTEFSEVGSIISFYIIEENNDIVENIVINRNCIDSMVA